MNLHVDKFYLNFFIINVGIFYYLQYVTLTKTKRICSLTKPKTASLTKTKRSRKNPCNETKTKRNTNFINVPTPKRYARNAKFAPYK